MSLILGTDLYGLQKNYKITGRTEDLGYKRLYLKFLFILKKTNNKSFLQDKDELLIYLNL